MGQQDSNSSVNQFLFFRMIVSKKTTTEWLGDATRLYKFLRKRHEKYQHAHKTSTTESKQLETERGGLCAVMAGASLLTIAQITFFTNDLLISCLQKAL